MPLAIQIKSNSVKRIQETDELAADRVRSIAELRMKNKDKGKDLFVRDETLVELLSALRDRFLELAGTTISSIDAEVVFRAYNSWDSFVTQQDIKLNPSLILPRDINIDFSDTSKYLLRRSYKGNQSIEGTVIKRSGDKTVKIEVETPQSTKVGKIRISRRRFLVHDELNQCNIGDKIVAQQCRPLSARKFYEFAGFTFRPSNVPKSALHSYQF